MILYIWPTLVLVWVFVIGAAVGSFLNVCIYRTAAGKSLAWPGSRCGSCFREVRLRDNLPLVSYWVLRGRCRDCGAPFSMRYFWVELLTAVAFVALYVLEIGLNVHRLPDWRPSGFTILKWGLTPSHSWQFFVFHAVLAGFLITATASLLDRGRVPASVAAAGTLVGLLGAVFFPWPYPEDPARLAQSLYTKGDPYTVAGLYPYPVWEPLPDALPPGSFRLGLVTGLAGALVGGWGLRLAAAVVRRASGRDFPAAPADLSMIAGAFLGWQTVLVALVLALALYPARRVLPFGLALALAVVAAWLGEAWLRPVVRIILFSPALLTLLVVAVLALVGIASASGGRQPPDAGLDQGADAPRSP
jgi:leader peptidase (prepilin peptidase)/N-methyltransferase